ncbi:MAG: RMD1 family protein, partial [Bacteroidota bacterium]|nr:RMD1 family protein [Bacteroidota bacterium]
MADTVKLHAFLISNQIDLKGIKSLIDKKPLADSSYELFYGAEGRYKYFFNYGVVVFAGIAEDEMKSIIASIQPHLKDPEKVWQRDEFQIRVDPDRGTAFEFAEAVVSKRDPTVMRVAMLKLAQ